MAPEGGFPSPTSAFTVEGGRTKWAGLWAELSHRKNPQLHRCSCTAGGRTPPTLLALQVTPMC